MLDYECWIEIPRVSNDRAVQVIRRLRAVRGTCSNIMRDFKPNEANAIDYRRTKGDYLGTHCDDRYLSGKVLCNL